MHDPVPLTIVTLLSSAKVISESESFFGILVHHDDFQYKNVFYGILFITLNSCFLGSFQPSFVKDCNLGSQKFEFLKNS